MLSLFMSIAGGVSWGQLLLPLHAISTVWIWVFLCYISFTSLGSEQAQVRAHARAKGFEGVRRRQV